MIDTNKTYVTAGYEYPVTLIFTNTRDGTVWGKYSVRGTGHGGISVPATWCIHTGNILSMPGSSRRLRNNMRLKEKTDV